jgi:nitrate reductase gamma subunit
MGFISGIFMGLIAGVALIFGLAHAMNRRAAKRSTKASAPTRTVD